MNIQIRKVEGKNAYFPTYFSTKLPVSAGGKSLNE